MFKINKPGKLDTNCRMPQHGPDSQIILVCNVKYISGGLKHKVVSTVTAFLQAIIM